MIIYDPQQKFTLDDFGIEIPVSDTRVTRTFDQLIAHRVIGARVQQWYINKVEETITTDDLLRVHGREYVDKLYSDDLENEIIRTYELIDSNGRYYRYNPQNAHRPLVELFDTIIAKAGGTLQCCRVALERGFSFYFGGGMHHAHRDYGSGFCLVNDIVIAIRKLQSEDAIKGAWIIDVDAHKGDGTAALTQGDDSVKTLSIHMAKGWPLEGEKYVAGGKLNPPFTPSDIDIPIGEGKDHSYVAKLAKGLSFLERQPRPDLAIVVAGADPYEKDELPSAKLLKLTLTQLKERDLLIYNFLKNRGIPQAYLMGGGYGDSSWEVYLQFLEWVLLDNLH